MFTRLACALVDVEGEVELAAGSLAQRAFGTRTATVPYRCSFGLDREYRPLLERAGVVFSGVDAVGEPRVAELPSHPFWLAMLFLPEMIETGERAHPAIRAFVEAAGVRAIRGRGGLVDGGLVR